MNEDEKARDGRELLHFLWLAVLLLVLVKPSVRAAPAAVVVVVTRAQLTTGKGSVVVVVGLCGISSRAVPDPTTLAIVFSRVFRSANKSCQFNFVK